MQLTSTLSLLWVSCKTHAPADSNEKSSNTTASGATEPQHLVRTPWSAAEMGPTVAPTCAHHVRAPTLGAELQPKVQRAGALEREEQTHDAGVLQPVQQLALGADLVPLPVAQDEVLVDDLEGALPARGPVPGVQHLGVAAVPQVLQQLEVCQAERHPVQGMHSVQAWGAAGGQLSGRVRATGTSCKLELRGKGKERRRGKQNGERVHESDREFHRAAFA